MPIAAELFLNQLFKMFVEESFKHSWQRRNHRNRSVIFDIKFATTSKIASCINFFPYVWELAFVNRTTENQNIVYQEWCSCCEETWQHLVNRI